MVEIVFASVSAETKNKTFGNKNHSVNVGGAETFAWVRGDFTSDGQGNFFDNEAVNSGIHNNIVDLGGGDDRINNSSGNDNISGGDGLDVFYFGNEPFLRLSLFTPMGFQPYSVTVNLSNGIAKFDGFYVESEKSEFITDDDGKAVGFKRFFWSKDDYGKFKHTISDFEGVSGTEGDDKLTGSGAAAEYFDGVRGNDTIDGRGGFDLISYSAVQSVDVNLNTGRAVKTIFKNGLTQQTDVINGIEAVSGSFGDDTLKGSDADEQFFGTLGSDIINGRDGEDWVLYDTEHLTKRDDFFFSSKLTEGVTADLSAGTVSKQNNDSDTLSGIKNLAGSKFDDTIKGDESGNILEGRSGADVIDGGNGKDTIDGGDGQDTLTGGKGKDVFKIDLEAEEFDIIEDFEFGVDSLDFI